MIIKEINHPKVSFSYLRKYNFELRETDRDSCDVISARHDNTIALTINNIEKNGTGSILILMLWLKSIHPV